VLRSLARPDAQPDQIAKEPVRRTRTWDTEASNVLPPLGSPTNKMQVIRGVEGNNVALPFLSNQGGGITLFAPAGGDLTKGSVNAAANAARVILP